MSYCITPETYKTLKGIVKFSEATWNRVMEVWDSNPDNQGLPTAQQALDINNQLINKDDTELMNLQAGIKKLVQRLHERKNNVFDALESKVTKAELKPVLSERFKELDAQIKDLEKQINTDLNEATMFKVANSHLDMVESWLSKPVITEVEFGTISRYLDMYKMFATDYIPKASREVLTEEGSVKSELYKRALSINSRVDELSIKMNEMEADDLYTKNTALKINPELTKDEMLAPRKDIGWFESNLRPMGLIGDSVLSIMSSISNLASNKASQLQNKYNEMVQGAFKNIKDSPLYQEFGYDIMYTKDNNGRVNGTTSRFNQAYYNERESMNKMLAAAKGTEDISTIRGAWSNWKKWQDENHKTYYSIFKGFDLENLTEDGALIVINSVILDDTRNHLVKTYGELRGNEYYKEAVDKVLDFVRDNQHFKDYFGKMPEGDKAYNIWKLSHNPITANENNGFLLIDGKHIPNKSYKYLVSRPLEKHVDNNYVKIMEDPIFREAFLTYQKVVRDYMKVLPPSFISNFGITKNFIPYVRKSLWESFKTEGWGLGIKELQRQMYDKIRSTEESSIIYDESSSTGDSSMSIPIHFMIPATTIEGGEVVTDVKAQQLDPEKILLTIIPQVANYQFKAQMQPFMEQAKRVVDNMKEEIGLDKDGKPKAANGLAQMKKLAQYNMEVFAGRANEKPGVTSKIVMTAEEKELLEIKKVNLQKSVFALEKELTEAGVDPGEIARKIEDKKAANEELLKAHTKKLSFGQTIRSLLRYYSLKTLGFSVTTALNEFVQGTSSIMIHAAGGEDFTGKQYWDAIKTHRTKKDTVLRNLYNINPANINGEMTESKFEKVGNWLTEQADTTSKGSVFAAKMKNTLIMSLNGPISLYDAYDEEGVWMSELFSPEVTAEWSQNLDATIEANRFYDFQNQVKELNMRLFGAYDKQAALMLKSNTYGKMAMMFKTWIGEAYAIRFESKKPSASLGRDVKGRWRSIYDVYDRNGIISTMTALFTGRTENLELVDGDLDAANIRKDMVEMYILLTCIAIATITAMAIDDEDDEDSVGYMAGILTINMVGRLQQDLTYFANPGEAKKLQDNLIPILRMSKDFVDVGEAFVKTVEGDHEVTQGVYRGWNRIGKESAELIPVTNTILKMYGTAKQDKSEID